jgi:hypothetical protein
MINLGNEKIQGTTVNEPADSNRPLFGDKRSGLTLSCYLSGFLFGRFVIRNSPDLVSTIISDQH